MHVLTARNVNAVLPSAVLLLRERGTVRPSRYGEVIELDEPVTTHYQRPTERVLFLPGRDANPFLHLFESLWILNGDRDVQFLAQFAKRMREFSDDGETYHAAYGHRLRKWGHDRRVSVITRPLDQLHHVIQMLREDPTSRRVVASIWDPDLDLNVDSKDLPCNDTLKFEARSGALNLIVFNRSNDLVWGTYGANVVQFSMIQEYVAGMAGLPVGFYEQISCNFHGYTATLGQVEHTAGWGDPYQAGDVRPFPLVGDPVRFDADLEHFMAVIRCNVPPHELQLHGTEANPFFAKVALPLYQAHRFHKLGGWHRALDYATECADSDWSAAALAWLARRKPKHA